MHDLAYDPTHDEIVVTSPLTQAILVFRGGANGEEAPIRVIQGPHTQILGVGAMDKVTVDPETGEIYLPTAKHNIVVFPYGANGDVSPKRVLGGPDTQIIMEAIVEANLETLVVRSRAEVGVGKCADCRIRIHITANAME